MARVDVNQIELFEAVLAHLRTTLSLDERSCYSVVDRHSPGLPHSGDFWVTLSLGSQSEFDDTLIDGGGIEQVTEFVPLIVAGYSRVKLDSTGHDHFLLTDDARGLLAIKKLILRTMTCEDIKCNNDTSTFLRNLPIPASAENPQLLRPANDADAAWGIGMVSVTFTCVFDWDLSPDP